MENFAELHLHIEGSLEPEFLIELGKRNNIKLPSFDLAELRGLYNFGDLQEFLNLYYKCMGALKTVDDYTELANRYLKRVAGTGLSHVEAFFDPQTHAGNGNDFAKVFTGLYNAFVNANSAFGIEANLIMCFERDRGTDEALKTLDIALDFLSDKPEMRKKLIGVGLDSAEAPYPPEPFAIAYKRAQDAGLNLTAHAGEEGSAKFIWSALDDLGVSRIDHGVRALEDKALLKRLAADQIPLTVCPLSNYALKVKPSKSAVAQTVLDLLDAGVLVTINSDDPAYFGGYIDDNFTLLQENGFDDDVIKLLKMNSLKGKWG
ncbi:MAG: adenosine deaminase [Bifidobacteriaceae bacterium]|nr:adenosine deaminase [Bifidobacteriaceae bacterium]